MSKDFFEHKADSYEKNKNRVDNVKNIADTIKGEIKFDKEMSIIDFGSGTGLLLSQIAPLVKKVTAIDLSPSMNEQLKAKKDSLECELELLPVDITKTKLEEKYDGIISSMTVHHVKDIKQMFELFYSFLNNGGFIALADLDKEDGSFHTDDTGVHHFGFDRDEIAKIAESVGFKEVKTQDASVVNKPHGDFPIFLITALK